MRVPESDPIHRAMSNKRRLLTIGMAGLLVLILAFVARITHLNTTFQPVASAQAQVNDHDHSSHVGGGKLAPLVDGSLQPELIPDDVAIRILMRTLRIPAIPDAADLKQLRAKTDRVGLSDSDMEELVRQLGIFDAQARAQEVRVEMERPSSAALPSEIERYRSEQRALRSLMEAHYFQLLAALSPEGRAKLQGHLAHVKSRTRIYPEPDMSSRTSHR